MLVGEGIGCDSTVSHLPLSRSGMLVRVTGIEFSRA